RMPAPLRSALFSLAGRRGSAMTRLRVAWSYKRTRTSARAARAALRRNESLYLRIQQARGVAGHQVDLEIDLITGSDGPERGDVQRVRDDQHRKRIAADVVYIERDAIERDRSFGSNKAGGIRGRAERKPR